jgi:hypothetical protein
MAEERVIDADERARLLGLLAAGDPKREVKLAWHAKEMVRSVYDHHDSDLALVFVTELPALSNTRRCHPRSDNSAARCAAGATRSSHGTKPTCRTDRPKQRTTWSSGSSGSGSGFTNFRNYRTRVLLYAAQLRAAPDDHSPLKSEEPPIQARSQTRGPFSVDQPVERGAAGLRRRGDSSLGVP